MAEGATGAVLTTDHKLVLLRGKYRAMERFWGKRHEEDTALIAELTEKIRHYESLLSPADLARSPRRSPSRLLEARARTQSADPPGERQIARPEFLSDRYSQAQFLFRSLALETVFLADPQHAFNQAKFRAKANSTLIDLRLKTDSFSTDCMALQELMRDTGPYHSAARLVLMKNKIMFKTCGRLEPIDPTINSSEPWTTLKLFSIKRIIHRRQEPFPNSSLLWLDYEEPPGTTRKFKFWVFEDSEHLLGHLAERLPSHIWTEEIAADPTTPLKIRTPKSQGVASGLKDSILNIGTWLVPSGVAASQARGRTSSKPSPPSGRPPPRPQPPVSIAPRRRPPPRSTGSSPPNSRTRSPVTTRPKLVEVPVKEPEVKEPA